MAAQYNIDVASYNVKVLEGAKMATVGLEGQLSHRDDTPLSGGWQDTASLTVQIFNYAVSPYQDWHDKAWTAALVLLLLVGSLSLAARLLSRSRLR